MTADRSQRRLVALGLAELVGRASSLVAIVLIARFTGPAAYGVFAYGYAAGSIAAAVVEGGMSGFLLREGAMRPALVADEVRAVARLRLAALTVCLLVVGAAVYLHGRSGLHASVALVLTAALGLRSVATTPMAALVGTGDTTANLTQQLVERAALLAGVGVLVALDPSPLSAAAGFALSGIVGIASAWTIWGRRHPVAAGSVPSLLNAIRRTWPFTLATVFIAAYFNGGALLVSFAASDTEVGVYGAAFGLYAALTGLSSLLMKSVMPDLAAGAQSPAAHRALGRVIFGGLAVPGLAAAVAPEITRLLLGDTFAPVAVVLTILCAGAMASYVAAWFVYVLYASGRERDYAAVVGIALLAFVLLGLPMAQRWAARGVAGALAATEVLGLVLLATLAQRSGLAPHGRSAARAALAGSVWGVAAAMSAAGAGAAARAMALPSPAVVALAVVVATLVSFPGAKALYLHPTPSAA